MRKYKLVVHTADIGVVAYGSSLIEAFANAAYGLFSIIADLRKVRVADAQIVSVKAQDIETLLFNWLNQLIYIFDVEHLLLKEFDITEFTERRLIASCRGEKYDPSRHQIKTGVKSATYHMLKVDREKNTVQVILDV